MEKKEFYYTSSNNINKIYAVKWIPEGKIKAILQISHGVTEHINRYNELAKYLTDKGILVVGNDHLGHGKTTGQRMYFGTSGSWNYIVKDIEKCRELITEEYKDIPYFMLGFSLGSFALRTHLIDYKPQISGAIIVGTGYSNNIEIALGTFMANQEAKKHGEENPTEKIRNLTFGTYNKKINNPQTECDWLCSSQKDLQIYLNDPLRGGCMSSGLFRELLSGMKYTSNKNNIEKMSKDLSILMLSGDKDPVGKETKGVNKVYHLFKKSQIQDVTLKYYKNLRHDILHEENKEEIYELIYEWIINHIVETI